ncbi:hypothetical protein B0H19DRAFT_1364978 [Mycena capillaripes]|nr:hypothetical protein B0H19DRAFT_1364978 [Mycena capillaripes]
MPPRKPFSGPSRKLVLGIDVGTTYAGMSYCLLEPDRIPDILPVTRFPSQDHVGGDSKVPSIIYYDRSGRVRACGAEALQEIVVEQAFQEGWEKAHWFKLHLAPNAGATILPLCLPPLPRMKTALDVFADFLRYLFYCAKLYITESYPNGGALWIGLESDMEFVLTHPNGWEGEEQAKMRRAAIIAGLIPDTHAGRQRVRFVTEGEASLHFCIMNGLATDPLRLGKGVVIIDAGGGTVDISAYRKLTTLRGETFEEIARPECLFAGSIWVSNRAHHYLTMKLRGSRYAGDVDHIRECFDKTTKLRFRRTNDLQYIKFGRPGDNDGTLNISSGQLKLEGEVVATFFRASLDAILMSMANLATQSPVSSVLLVGGFGASDWLYSELKTGLKLRGLDVSRPDSHVNKAVADGAVSFYLDHFVSVRVAKHTYGTECVVPYISNNPEHRARSKSVRKNAAGDLNVPRSFSAILHKDTRVSETQEFREFKVLCTVHADTSKIAKTLNRKLGLNGIYYSLDLDVVLSFGLTELTAQIAWIENGVEKRGPAELVY